MQRLQAFKYELMPNGEQQRNMRRFAGARRFVFNKALALQKARYEQGEKKLNYARLCKLLTEWRKSTETAWLADAPVHPLQQTLKDLERAYANFFAKRADLPRFKKKGQHDSFRYPDPKQFKLDQANARIFLPKLGWLRYRNSGKVLGAVKNVTVSQSCGRWFVSIQTEREVEQPVPQGDAVGVDMGIIRFATLSDGTFHAPLNSFRRHETALRKAQQALSRKTRFSANWKKVKTRIQRIHARIGNARRNYLHKATTTISQNHAMGVSRTCRFGICPGPPREAPDNRENRFGPSPSSTKAGSSSAVSWTTSWRGMAGISSPCRRRTRAELARAEGRRFVLRSGAALSRP